MPEAALEVAGMLRLLLLLLLLLGQFGPSTPACRVRASIGELKSDFYYFFVFLFFFFGVWIKPSSHVGKSFRRVRTLSKLPLRDLVIQQGEPSSPAACERLTRILGLQVRSKTKNFECTF